MAACRLRSSDSSSAAAVDWRENEGRWNGAGRGGMCSARNEAEMGWGGGRGGDYECIKFERRRSFADNSKRIRQNS